MLNFIVQHPVVILYLAAGWFIAAIISAMPPLPPGQNFFVRWAYSVAQIIGASLDKVGKAAVQTPAFKQVESTLQITDGTGVKKLETTNVITQAATPAATPPTTTQQ